MIPYGRQAIDQDDIEAVVEVLESDFLTQGACVPEFEKAICSYTGAEFGVAVNSATSALHIACLALGVNEGDTVWTSPISFVASSNCALYCGAKVDFVDIDPQTYNLSVAALGEKLLEHRRKGLPLPKVVIPVHFSGQVCDMAGIARLALEYGFRVIEDASHAIGATFMDTPVGACQFSDITVFSFHPVKIITTGEGGLATTNDGKLAAAMQLLRSHCITRDQREMVNTQDPWYYEQVSLGFNYRMTDMQAALGLSQLHKLDDFIRARNEIVQRYTEQLAGLEIQLPVQSQGQASSWHLYVVQVKANHRRRIYNALRASNIGVNVHYIPIYHQPFYQKLGFKKGLCPNAEAYYAGCISLPMFPRLTVSEQQHVVDTLKTVVTEEG